MCQDTVAIMLELTGVALQHAREVIKRRTVVFFLQRLVEAFRPLFSLGILVIPANIAGMAVLIAEEASFSFMPSWPATLRTIDCPIELFNNSDKSILFLLLK